MDFFNIPGEFYLFGFILLGIAIFHHHSLKIALAGFLLVLIYKLAFHHFNFFEHMLGAHGEWRIVLNLFGLLTGFAILAKHFEDSGLPRYMPALLPDDWKGGFVLLLLTAVLSSFLDNIAAALIGASVARVVFQNRLHIGYLVALVAASNAGGAGSVLGDTTTTMMWIAGIPAINVLHAYIGSVTAILFFSYFASRQQQAFHRILKHEKKGEHIKIRNLVVVTGILAGAILTNVLIDFPALGVWIAILAGLFLLPMPRKEFWEASVGSLFLICLVLVASMMPVESLPVATWKTTWALGFISAFFDNIPLTKLALDQGGYDWGVLAYAVGFGGSMLWFGSSAGVAVAGKFEQAKSTMNWIKSGWHVIVAYILGYLAIILTLGWNP